MPTSTVDLSGVADAMNAAFVPLLFDRHRNNVVVGGAASGKSYDTAIKVVYKTLAEKGHRFLVVRKVGATVKHSCYDTIRAVIASWGMDALFRYNLTDLSITCNVNGNQILFTGLDDVEKLKSIFGVTDIWIEEASEISEAEYNQLDLRLRGESPHKKQITLTMNPISALHWVKRRFFDLQEPDTLTHRTTYLDNRFLDADTRTRLAGITDPYFRKVYVLGEWGVYGNVVFTDFAVEEFSWTDGDLENVCTGMDFGFAHAQAVERIGFRDGEVYVFDELYAKEHTNAQFMEAARSKWGDAMYRWEITADSANPDKIQEWGDAGYRVMAAKKGDGSLRFGIEYLVGRRMHIHAGRCPNMAREVQSFKRREDKDGNVLESFVEIDDDCIAAARYATEWIWSQSHARVADGYGAADLGL